MQEGNLSLRINARPSTLSCQKKVTFLKLLKRPVEDTEYTKK